MHRAGGVAPVRQERNQKPLVNVVLKQDARLENDSKPRQRRYPQSVSDIG